MGDREFEGLTRRETLKRGLKLGAVLWVAPVVQVVGMRPAFAQTVSPDPCERTAAFRAKTTDEAGEGEWENDPGFGANDCATCAGAPGVDGDDYFTIVGDEDEVTVTLKPGTDCQITAIFAKGGQGTGSCTPPPGGDVASDGQSATVGRPPNDAGISHVEVCFTCCVED